jgi:hypothetical protein
MAWTRAAFGADQVVPSILLQQMRPLDPTGLCRRIHAFVDQHRAWPQIDGPASRWIDVFQGGKPFAFAARAGHPWLRLSQAGGPVDRDVRLEVSADWRAVPTGLTEAGIEIHGEGGERAVVKVPVSKPAGRRRGYVEVAGQLAIEAAHYGRAVARTASNGVRFPISAAPCRA